MAQALVNNPGASEVRLNFHQANVGVPAGSPLSGATRKSGAMGTRELPRAASCIWSLCWHGPCFRGGPWSLASAQCSFPPLGRVHSRCGQRLNLFMPAQRRQPCLPSKVRCSVAARRPIPTWSALWWYGAPGLGFPAHLRALALAPGWVHLECAGQRLPGG